jgi:hypothetical protein
LSFTIPPLPPYIGPPEFQAWWQQMAETVMVAVNDILIQQQQIEGALRDSGIALSAAQSRMVAPPAMFLSLPGDLPAEAQFARYDGGDDVTLNTEWSLSVVSGTITASIGAADGLLEVTALGTNSVLEVLSIRDDVPLLTLYSVNIDDGGALGVVHLTAGDTLATNEEVATCDATGGAFTVVLPPAAAVSGRVFTIKKVDASANAVTVDANAAELIDGAATATLTTQWESVDLRSSGTAWLIT